jgi:hypothetical protein
MARPAQGPHHSERVRQRAGLLEDWESGALGGEAGPSQTVRRKPSHNLGDEPGSRRHRPLQATDRQPCGTHRLQDDLHGWLGASPDGLIDASLSRTYTGGGILEVKCPHNKGSPETGSPWTSVPHYYMPQAQGLLEIFDREWMDFYVWCVNGSSIYRIYRDERYWGLIFRVMSEYWWGHVVPARHHLQKGNELDRVQKYRPQAKHPLTDEIVSMSRLLAVRAPLIWKDVKSPAFGSDQHLQEKLELFYYSL